MQFPYNSSLVYHKLTTMSILRIICPLFEKSSTIKVRLTQQKHVFYTRSRLNRAKKNILGNVEQKYNLNKAKTNSSQC